MTNWENSVKLLGNENNRNYKMAAKTKKNVKPKEKKEVKPGHTLSYLITVDEVTNMLLENAAYTHSGRTAGLTEKVMAKYDVSTREAQRYIADAKLQIKEITERKKEEAFKKAIMDREYLYRKAIGPNFIFNKDCLDENGNLLLVADLKLALEVAKDRDKLFGLYDDENNISDKDIIINVITQSPTVTDANSTESDEV